jgi:hypothetical protein
MPIDLTLTPEQQRLRADARYFARDVLSKVVSAPRPADAARPLRRHQTVLRTDRRSRLPASLIPASLQFLVP